MINSTLYKREMKGSIRLLIIFAAIITMYVTIIISMYNPKMQETLKNFEEIMPELMAAVGMTTTSSSLIGFMISYLYGFILLVFPMVFCIFRANSLIAKYVDSGSMVCLVASPVKRKTIAITQISALLSGIVILLSYSTILELIACKYYFPGKLVTSDLLLINTGLLCLQLFIGSVCFICSCIFSDTKYSIGFGAGIPALMYIVQMLANTGEKADKLKYCSFFTLYDPTKLLEGTTASIIGIIVLLGGAIILYTLGAWIFNRKDLHI